MSKQLQLIGVLLLLVRCNLLKSNTSRLDRFSQSAVQNEYLKTQEKKDWLNKSASLQWSVTTDTANYAIELWPRGVFTYSAESGFRGEAEKIKLIGDSKRNNVLSRSTQSEQHDQGSSTAEQKQQSNVQKDQLQKTSKTVVSWKVILTGVVVAALVAWFAYRKLTN